MASKGTQNGYYFMYGTQKDSNIMRSPSSKRKKYSKNPNTVKSMSFCLNVWKWGAKSEIEENEPEKLNKLLIAPAGISPRRRNPEEAL